MVDDYAGYKVLFAAGSVTELACLAHVRRKFFELHAANKSLVAAQALDAIGRLYQIERQATDWSAPERQALRMTEAKPVLDAWRVWLTETRLKVPDSSGTAKAIDYALRCFPALLRYLDEGLTRSTTIRSRTRSVRWRWVARTGCSPVPRRRGGAPPQS